MMKSGLFKGVLMATMAAIPAWSQHYVTIKNDTGFSVDVYIYEVNSQSGWTNMFRIDADNGIDATGHTDNNYAYPESIAVDPTQRRNVKSDAWVHLNDQGIGIPEEYRYGAYVTASKVTLRLNRNTNGSYYFKYVSAEK